MPDKLPPHNAEAEKATLGAMILNPKTVYMVAHFLRADDFYISRNRDVYEAILSLKNIGQRCDPVTLDAELSSQNGQVKEPWIDYIAELVEYPPDEEGAVDYAKIVAEKATRRRMIAASGTLNKLAYEEEGDITSQLGQAETTVFDVRGHRNGTGVVNPEDYTTDYLKTLERLRDNKRELVGLSTGFVDLDRLLNGLQAPHHYVIAGRPSMGKSALALNIADHAARSGGRVAFFSLEMSHKQIMDRRVATATGISCFDRVKKPWLWTDSEAAKIYNVVGEMSALPLYIEDQAALTPSEIRAKAMRLHAEHGLDLIVVDHLHRMKPDTSRRRTDLEIAENTRALTALYKTLNVPGITVAQLSRGVEHRGDKRPVLSDLRETGAIEEEAYAAMFLYRDEYYNPETTERPNIAEVNVAKHRDGPTGTIDLYWSGQLVRFRNLQRESITI